MLAVSVPGLQPDYNAHLNEAECNEAECVADTLPTPVSRQARLHMPTEAMPGDHQRGVRDVVCQKGSMLAPGTTGGGAVRRQREVPGDMRKKNRMNCDPFLIGLTCPAITVVTVILRALVSIGSVRGHLAASLDRPNPRPPGVA